MTGLRVPDTSYVPAGLLIAACIFELAAAMLSHCVQRAMRMHSKRTRQHGDEVVAKVARSATIESPAACRYAIESAQSKERVCGVRGELTIMISAAALCCSIPML